MATRTALAGRRGEAFAVCAARTARFTATAFILRLAAGVAIRREGRTRGRVVLATVVVGRVAASAGFLARWLLAGAALAGSPAPHGVPFSRARLPHCPSAERQTPSLPGSSWLWQLTPAPAVHTPLWQLSPEVQLSWSALQPVPLALDAAAGLLVQLRLVIDACRGRRAPLALASALLALPGVVFPPRVAPGALCLRQGIATQARRSPAGWPPGEQREQPPPGSSRRYPSRPVIMTVRGHR
ncbi:MAG: hypothetical protein KC442_06290 [Thermomicrobiales bacterium]|nr:hypothetical protein [Thermomicrobiales bacterium]